MQENRNYWLHTKNTSLCKKEVKAADDSICFKFMIRLNNLLESFIHKKSIS